MAYSGNSKFEGLDEERVMNRTATGVTMSPELFEKVDHTSLVVCY